MGSRRWHSDVLVLASPAVLVVAVQVVLFPMPVGAALSGLILGVLGALSAVGLALVWRANRVINFAQGDMGTLPATLAVLLVTLAGLPWLVGVTLGLLAALVVGLAADILVVRRFFSAPRLNLTVATIGLSQVLAFGGLLLPQLWGEGAAIRSMPPPFSWSVEIGGVVFDANDLIAAVVAPLLLLALAVVLRRTETGTAVRAAAERSDRAMSLGVPVRRLEAQIWTAAAVLSFVAVVLTAGVAGLPFGVGLGLTVLLRSLAAVVLGRMTHLVAIAATAISLGLLESGVRWNQGDAWLMSPILAALIIVSLLWTRATTGRHDAASSSWTDHTAVRPVPWELRRLREVRLARVATIGSVLAAVLFVPLLMGTNGQLKAGVVVTFCIVGVSIVILTGWAGLVSLGQMTFVGAGGAVGAWSMAEHGIDPVATMFIAAVVGALVAVVVGLPALRLRGMYLAVTTLAASLAASAWVFSNRLGGWIPTGSFDRPEVLGLVSLDSPLRLYYFTLFVLVSLMAGMGAVRRTRTGRVLVALRDNDVGAASFGVSPTRVKLTAFAASGAIAAVAGVTLVLQQAAFREVSYGADESVAVFVATVIGGLGGLGGAVYGALFQRGSMWLLPAPWSFLASGVGVLFVLLSFPRGIEGAVTSLRDRYLTWVTRRNGITSLSIERSAGAEPGDEPPVAWSEIIGAVDDSDVLA